jgi:hypothetical protein
VFPIKFFLPLLLQRLTVTPRADFIGRPSPERRGPTP